MKQYEKTYEDLQGDWGRRLIANASAASGTLEELAIRYRDFHRDLHHRAFLDALKHLWIEKQFLYRGRPFRHRGNGLAADAAYGYFAQAMGGILQKIVTRSPAFSVVAAYVDELFPHLRDRSPFDYPEEYPYPFEHVTLDHMLFVQACDERMEMLRYADEQRMTYPDFVNWATNHVLCTNDELGKDLYVISAKATLWPKIAKRKS